MYLVTYRQIAEKAACTTCGAVRGKFCSVGAGRLRSTPHPQRRLDAGENKVHNLLSFLGLKK